VTRDHVIAFRDHLEAEGYTATNIGQHLAKLHTLFELALSEGIVASNPSHGVKARIQATAKFVDDEGEPFTASHVKRIFGALPGETADFQWIIRLLAYHGARSGEICQLKCSDVTTLHGIPVLRIHDRYGSVKNKHSVRDVPIHPKCKGIVGYARKIANTHGEDSWLFPSLKDAKAGRAHGFQNYANGKFLRRKVGIIDKQPGARQYDHTIHSFRHLFSTLCREVEMPDAVKNALKGHVLAKGEGGKYGEGPSLKVRARWMAKVDPLKG
jgi:integrase